MLSLKEIQKFHESLPEEDCFTFDIGNTNPHVGIWKKGKLEEVRPLEPHNISDKLKDFPVDKTIVCSVSKSIPSADVFQEFSKSKTQDPKSFLGMPVNYENTLGHDRLILAAYIYQALHKRPSLVIDAGTFITMDFLDEEGLQGGFIIPGFKTLEKSYQVGSQLFSSSDLSSLFSNTSWEKYSWPSTTKEAIDGGHKFLAKALLEKVESAAKKLKEAHPELNIIITGGCGDLFAKQLNTQDFHPHLLHYSLYFQQVSSLL